MGKIGLIIRREYMTRVKKKSFIILTLLGPVLWAGIVLVPAFLNDAAESLKHVYVVDDTRLYYDIFQDNPKVKFDTTFYDQPIGKVREMFKNDEDAIVLHINKEVLTARMVTVYSKNQPNVNITSLISITIASELQRDLLKVNHLDKSFVDEYIKPVNVASAKIESGQVSNTAATFYVAFALGMITYFFIFVYASQVMRGVIEEKTSRVIEVIISSVKPFQLMMGKIIGIAMVGLTQFLLWVFLSGTVITPLTGYILTEKHYKEISGPEHSKHEVKTNTQIADPGQTRFSRIWDFFAHSGWSEVVLCFIFYFLVGYLLYAAIFAAVGSAVDSETDTQQFMLPVTIPLILSISMSGVVLTNPDGPVAFWFSMIPLTSPVVMMMRLPYGVPPWQMILSMTLLLAGFFVTTWLAARIYRTGILMYGKKSSWKELGKWLFYKG
ncbi:MAG: ABC transporter permease [Bacteroidia bacterium]